MVGKILRISNTPGSIYPVADFDRFMQWAREQRYLQVDIETNITDWWDTRELISIQFGSCTQERLQFFFQWSELSNAQKESIKHILENPTICKLAHNARYEYIVLRFYGIIMENIYDTMLAEKVLQGGLETEDYALADISYKYLRIIMDKSEQTTFGDNVITDSKIRYGITDVAYLDVIRRMQMADASTKNLLNVIALECEALLAFSDITYEGMILDKVKWRENAKLAEPIVADAFKAINDWLTVEPFRSHAIKLGYLSDQDRMVLNVNAPAQKSEVLKLIFPDIPGAGLPVIKKYLRDNGKDMETDKFNVLISLQEKNTEPLCRYLERHHRDHLVDKGYIIPAGKITINWNSVPQVLPLMQIVEPRLKDLSAESVAKTVHPIFKALAAYKDALKLVTTYGEPFIQKYCGPDGRVRTNFNQVVSTGRVSTSNPNMQNIIVTEMVGTRYRNAFICEPGWVFVDSDFVSQELVIIAYISKDPVWMEVIRKGQDLHSVCAELVYKAKWKQAADPDCAYYKMQINIDGKLEEGKQKCKCKKHKTLRDGIKTINFGLAYGMSEIKLAATLKISYHEASALINEYFATFPLIARTLKFLGDFGVSQGYIQTLAPFYRKRWFPYWAAYRNWIEAHMEGIKYIPTLGEIERASKNMPIQGASADITKCAMILIRNYIRDNNLRDKVRFQAQVHDQITTIAREDYAEEWKIILDKLMCDGGLVVVPTGILKAETNISSTWTK